MRWLQSRITARCRHGLTMKGEKGRTGDRVLDTVAAVAEAAVVAVLAIVETVVEKASVIGDVVDSGLG